MRLSRGRNEDYGREVTVRVTVHLSGAYRRVTKTRNKPYNL